jgi:parallel beta-helix repeat protein
MWLFSLLRNRTSNSAARARSQCRRPAPRLRPQLEVLEDRCVPSTLTVTNNLDNIYNVSPGSLRYEINVAQSGDTIVFANSLKGQTITLSGEELWINKNLNIEGLGANYLAISGGNNSRVFEIAGAQVTLSGLTIEGGDGQPTSGGTTFPPYEGDGGGILNGGALALGNCTVTGNHSGGFGGGIYNFGTLTVSGSTVTSNSASFGGGIYNDVGSTATVSGCTLSGNSAYNAGGGIYNYYTGTMTVSGCTISGNSASYDGGGIYNNGTFTGSLTVSGSTVTSNSADVGGGIYNAGKATVDQTTVSANSTFKSMGSFYDTGGGIYNAGTLTVSGSTVTSNYGNIGGGIYNAGTATVEQTTVSGNSALYSGGGIYNSGTLTVKGCSLSLNSAKKGDGGGIYNAGTQTDLSVSNSSFSHNKPDNIFGPYTDGGGNSFS